MTRQRERWILFHGPFQADGNRVEQLDPGKTGGGIIDPKKRSARRHVIAHLRNQLDETAVPGGQGHDAANVECQNHALAPT